MGTSTIELADRLKTAASAQGGFFTASQAVSLGYVDSVHGYHVRNGDWERAGRGIYRFKGCPLPKHPKLFILLLWSRGKNGVPTGIFCRNTAMFMHKEWPDLPKTIQMYVPPSFRRNSLFPNGLELFREPVSKDDIEVIDGLPVTNLRKTMADLAVERTKPKIIPEFSEKPLYFARSAYSEVSSSVLIIRPGEWSPGVSFEEALVRGED